MSILLDYGIIICKMAATQMIFKGPNLVKITGAKSGLYSGYSKQSQRNVHNSSCVTLDVWGLALSSIRIAPFVRSPYRLRWITCWSSAEWCSTSRHSQSHHKAGICSMIPCMSQNTGAWPCGLMESSWTFFCLARWIVSIPWKIFSILVESGAPKTCLR